MFSKEVGDFGFSILKNVESSTAWLIKATAVETLFNLSDANGQPFQMVQYM
jgi:hypothetical protein